MRSQRFRSAARKTTPHSPHPYLWKYGRARIHHGIDFKNQGLRPLMERFGATKKVPSIAKRLKNMVGTRRLELLTSTVSINRRGDCQNSRKSYKTSHFVGWIVGPEIKARSLLGARYIRHLIEHKLRGNPAHSLQPFLSPGRMFNLPAVPKPRKQGRRRRSIALASALCVNRHRASVLRKLGHWLKTNAAP
jgi:hypothetical protein